VFAARLFGRSLDLCQLGTESLIEALNLV